MSALENLQNTVTAATSNYIDCDAGDVYDVAASIPERSGVAAVLFNSTREVPRGTGVAILKRDAEALLRLALQTKESTTHGDDDVQ